MRKHFNRGTSDAVSGRGSPLHSLGINMNRATLFALLGLLVVLTVAASSTGPRLLSGSFVITGNTPVDPPPKEPRDTHILFYLTGEVCQLAMEPHEGSA